MKHKTLWLLTGTVVALGFIASINRDHEYQRAVRLDVKYELAKPVKERLVVRKVYPHSLIPGGINSVEEFEQIVNRDGVLRDFYSGINSAHLRPCVLPKGRYFVTEREGNRITWSQHPIEKGEQSCLTDGVRTILTKCGNEVLFSTQDTGESIPPNEIEGPHYEEIEVPKFTPTQETVQRHVGAGLPPIKRTDFGGIIPVVLFNHKPEPPPQRCNDMIEFGRDCN